MSSALRAHEALPQTPPGGKPPETPAPLSLLPHYSEQSESVKGSQAAQKPRALDRFGMVGKADRDVGKGGHWRGRHSGSRWSAPERYANLKNA